jgi:ribosome biogenesis GTPase
VTLEELGWDDAWAAAAAAAGGGADVEPARIRVEHRGAYEAIGASGPIWAELRGRDYHEARDKRALPTVGDWVLVARGGPGVAPIHALLPRRSSLVRAAAGEKVAPQPIAANVDVAFVVTSANQDLNPRRIERYLTTVRDGGAAPVILLNKIDLVADPAPMLAALAQVAPGVPVVACSAERGDGIDQALAHLGPGRTGVVVGSSGVGKSTLINRLLGTQAQEVRAIREDDARGRHATTRRELFVLAGGGILIDTPGMRELKPWTEPDASGDDVLAFDDVAELAAGCRFGDCAHGGEPGCAVTAAVAAGEMAAERLEAWRKLHREQDEQSRKRLEKQGARSLRQRLRDKGRKD